MYNIADAIYNRVHFIFLVWIIFGQTSLEVERQKKQKDNPNNTAAVNQPYSIRNEDNPTPVVILPESQSSYEDPNMLVIQIAGKVVSSPNRSCSEGSAVEVL